MDSEQQQVNTQTSATESAGLQLSNLPQSEPSLDSGPPLDLKDLIDLFKHWDTRVSHQEKRTLWYLEDQSRAY
jgi:hypothetical protein